MENLLNEFNQFVIEIHKEFNKIKDLNKIPFELNAKFEECFKKIKIKEIINPNGFDLNYILENEQEIRKYIHISEIESYLNFSNLIDKFISWINVNYEKIAFIMNNPRYIKNWTSPIKFEICKLIKNYESFKKIKDFNYDKGWYQKIIFKELYSLLEKTMTSYCNVISWENLLNETEFATEEKEKQYIKSISKKTDTFNAFIENKSIKKNQGLIMKKFNDLDNKVYLILFKHNILNHLEFNKIWKLIGFYRNSLEHNLVSNFIDTHNCKSNILVRNESFYIKYLIGLNFYFIMELSNYKILNHKNQ